MLSAPGIQLVLDRLLRQWGVEPDSITFAACQAFVDEWVAVDEAEIADAMLQTRHHTGIQIEGWDEEALTDAKMAPMTEHGQPSWTGAAGVAVASCLKVQHRLKGQHVVIIICGGNVTDAAYAKAERLLAAQKSSAV